ncbi:hypothetical protein [Phaeocystidibacter marisrubri]|uniref:Uncharacterized protein n=1 Tax=Phaeocystidibacter marisrubri TaxID=1577780 RepID=A0A6L3ZEI6_9FLAO|nr:hypothetical protein [Phaeocystidibacter marisrubri]KAB2816245.1 hypothetical protein F8C82_11195 [Phaeocystidibacter marisrubri]GGH68039.1 hypothetical protein GCM10011318_07670 [Phaeocystidibacter marisrubri]
MINVAILILHSLLAVLISNSTEPSTTIHCDENGCRGEYVGPEFIEGSDIAHQFSNSMSVAVGDELKEQYNNGHYVKVDFSKLKMSTKGMGSGNVTYALVIPFIEVPTKCEAYTSFDHCGGWNHSPALERRKRELSSVTLPDESLDISDLKTTPEGLEEYWIQWKNKALQGDCQ